MQKALRDACRASAIFVLSGVVASCGQAPSRDQGARHHNAQQNVVVQKTALAPRISKKIAASLSSKTTLDASDILEAIREGEAYKPADQFSPNFDATALVGKRVELTYSDATFLHWTYDADTENLEVVFWQSSLAGAVGRTFSIKSTSTSLGTYPAQNGFGATTDVAVKSDYEIGLVEAHPISLGEQLMCAKHCGPLVFPSGSYLKWKFHVPPTEAREITRGLSVRVSATISPRKDRSILHCS